MKKLTKHITPLKMIVFAALAVTWLAFAGIEKFGRNLEVNDKTTGTAIVIKKPTSTTAKFLQAYAGSSLKFEIPATGVLPLTYGGTGGATAKAARTSMGLPEWTTNATILPVANGGTGGDTPSAALISLGVRCGTVLTSDDGTVTNVWSPVFTRAPIVVLTPAAAVPQGSNVVRVVSSTVGSNVFFGHTNTTYNFVAVQTEP